MLTIEERFRSADGTDGLTWMAAAATHGPGNAARRSYAVRLAASVAIAAIVIALMVGAAALVLGYA